MWIVNCCRVAHKKSNRKKVITARNDVSITDSFLFLTTPSPWKNINNIKFLSLFSQRAFHLDLIKSGIKRLIRIRKTRSLRSVTENFWHKFRGDLFSKFANSSRVNVYVRRNKLKRNRRKIAYEGTIGYYAIETNRIARLIARRMGLHLCESCYSTRSETLRSIILQILRAVEYFCSSLIWN